MRHTRSSLLVTCLAVPVLFAPQALAQTPADAASSSSVGSTEVGFSAFAVQQGSPEYRRGYRNGRLDGFRTGWKLGKETCRREDRVHDSAAPNNDYDRGWADGEEFGFQLGLDRALEHYCH